MLKNQIEKLLNEAESGVKVCFFYSSTPASSDEDTYYEGMVWFNQSCREAGIDYKYEDNFGGEGMGDEYWSVYSFFQGEEKVYVKFSGWYQSYNGAEYTDWFFVEPKQKTITVYE